MTPRSVLLAMCGVTVTRFSSPEGVIRWQRLARHRVQRRAPDVTAGDGGEQVGFHQMVATADVDHVRAARQLRKQVCRQEALGFDGERQQADQGVAAREEIR